MDALRVPVDARIMALVRRAGPGSPAYRCLYQAVFNTSEGFLAQWAEDGDLFTRTAAAGFPAPVPVPSSFEHDAQGLFHRAAIDAAQATMDRYVGKESSPSDAQHEPTADRSLVSDIESDCLRAFAFNYSRYHDETSEPTRLN